MEDLEIEILRILGDKEHNRGKGYVNLTEHFKNNLQKAKEVAQELHNEGCIELKQTYLGMTFIDSHGNKIVSNPIETDSLSARIKLKGKDYLANRLQSKIDILHTITHTIVNIIKEIGIAIIGGFILLLIVYYIYKHYGIDFSLNK